ncbi:uncharacterized protein ARMOST_03215 [Armillaria ostoyae]|uniref:Uncharacterized protein n=1 Tax=Armillaria ostoyae TaxID=47428 RepID=A0A284QTU3_ARMOS|nr:uncharacterized protein ARMOST_03215 [Armillaria ostoyae]
MTTSRLPANWKDQTAWPISRPKDQLTLRRRQCTRGSQQPPTDPPQPSAKEHLHQAGKDPDRGRPPALPPVPNWQHPLWKQEDRYSVLCPPEGKGRPDPLPQLVSLAEEHAPYLGIKLVLMQTPKPFTGNHDNIDQFLGDCIIYFEAFALYFHLPSQMFIANTGYNMLHTYSEWKARVIIMYKERQKKWVFNQTTGMP